MIEQPSSQQGLGITTNHLTLNMSVRQLTLGLTALDGRFITVTPTGDFWLFGDGSVISWGVDDILLP